jgi:hypothetical protein
MIDFGVGAQFHGQCRSGHWAVGALRSVVGAGGVAIRKQRPRTHVTKVVIITHSIFYLYYILHVLGQSSQNLVKFK